MHHINPQQFRFEHSVSQSLRRFAMSSILHTNWFNQFADFLDYEWIRTVPRIEGNKNRTRKINPSMTRTSMILKKKNGGNYHLETNNYVKSNPYSSHYDPNKCSKIYHELYTCKNQNISIIRNTNFLKKLKTRF